MGAYLVAMAAWLGGLVALAVLLVPRDLLAGLDRVWTRFSWFTGLSVSRWRSRSCNISSPGDSDSRSTVLLLVELPMLVAMVLLSRYAVAYGKSVAFASGTCQVLQLREANNYESQRNDRSSVDLVGSHGWHGGGAARRIASAGWPGAPPLREPVPTTGLATAEHARPAASDTPRFIPDRIGLPGGASAAIVPVATVGRELVLPESGGTVGCWNESSYVGDPYRSTVIAGHVDTVERGIGFFFRLWNIQFGERVVFSAGHLRQAYKFTKLRQLPRAHLVDRD